MTSSVQLIGLLSIPILLYLSAFFDTISHTILMEHLTGIGITGVALSWFSSYHAVRQQFVQLENHKSISAAVEQAVPQGSVLCPLLFTIYLLPLGLILCLHGVCPLSLSCWWCPALCLCPSPLLSDCLDIKSWMSQNLLKLNGSKKFCVGSKATRSKATIPNIMIDDFPVPIPSQVNSLGVILDNTLLCPSYQLHISDRILSSSQHSQKLLFTDSIKLPKSWSMHLYPHR